jgi:hypothetical protein
MDGHPVLGENVTNSRPGWSRPITAKPPVLRLSDYRRRMPAVCFRRDELNQLLSLYSRRVIGGEWRDYAIDQDARHAAFSIFRRSSDRPIFTVCKFADGTHPDGNYVLYSGRTAVKRGQTMDEALAWFERSLRLVN